MTTFEVKDMTCGHCVSTITKALKSVDEQAQFTIDQASQRVTIESSTADPQTLRDAIAEAGYTPVSVEAGAPKSDDQAKTCCGRGQ
ncbi:heavy-metal-associated domain-containing protein [Pseudomonas aeruginosa]|jgi:copper chaperone|uniref:Heavy-metal-associated domain-containing protein n=1 Tax=Pseudomonas rhodesiae TaxID=76760 RepID=A0A8I1E7R0_9PSED|nr:MULTISPECIES: heavy-metal-associated domain-containing protein [Pseudomonas]KFJ91432.1 heavy metal transporter [Pseudomonas sp. 1-7]KIL05080.1 heavy metal transporter [Stutzerimonas stutzeri]EKX3738710.1 heavy-metal-associated domain-containing protein [Pseudomonas aeruginosa]ELQ8104511.1 heavy-metal-associated domain-containing protein [Pseudomonas aeruginosa]ELZ4498576.1 heavy-metal-associated domain-containing protein [Pseudomonas aeruginosa]